MLLEEVFSQKSVNHLGHGFTNTAAEVFRVFEQGKTKCTPRLVEEGLLFAMVGMLYASGRLSAASLSALSGGQEFPSFAEKLRHLSMALGGGASLTEGLHAAGFGDAWCAVAAWNELRTKNGAPFLFSQALVQILQAENPKAIPDFQTYARTQLESAGLLDSEFAIQELDKFSDLESRLSHFLQTDDEAKRNEASIGLLFVRLGYLYSIGTPLVEALYFMQERASKEAGPGAAICAIAGYGLSQGQGIGGSLRLAGVWEWSCLQIGLSEVEGSFDHCLRHQAELILDMLCSNKSLASSRQWIIDRYLEGSRAVGDADRLNDQSDWPQLDESLGAFTTALSANDPPSRRAYVKRLSEWLLLHGSENAHIPIEAITLHAALMNTAKEVARADGLARIGDLNSAYRQYGKVRDTLRAAGFDVNRPDDSRPEGTEIFLENFKHYLFDFLIEGITRCLVGLSLAEGVSVLKTVVPEINAHDFRKVAELLRDIPAEEEIASDCQSADSVWELYQAMPSDTLLVELCNETISAAHQNGVQDIFFRNDPNNNKTFIEFGSDGKISLFRKVHRSLMHGIAARLKKIGELDISECRIPQTGLIDFKKYAPLDIQLRITTYPTRDWYEDVVLQIVLL